jgi:hypothetical protein
MEETSCTYVFAGGKGTRMGLPRLEIETPVAVVAGACGNKDLRLAVERVEP